MKWGIIGALDAEVALLRDQMKLERTVEACGCTYYCGTLCDSDVVVVCCSVGTINAAVCATLMLREFGVEALVNVGIAGSACPELHILDVIVADDLVFHDADLDILEKYYPFRKNFETDPKLRDLAVRAIEVMPERAFEYKIGRIASGDEFVSSSERKEDIVRRCAPLCVEMEGAAIAQAAHMHGVPCLVIRTLSDNADESADESFDSFLERSAHQSAHILINMLQLHNA